MEFTLKKDSWHFWVANFMTKRIRPEWNEGNDICSYTRAFFAGLFWLAMAAVFGVGGVCWVGASLWSIFSYLFLNNTELGFYAQLFLFVVGTLISFIAIIAAHVKIREYRDEHPAKEKPPGFVKLAYRKFKDKTCFRLNFE